MKRNVLLNSHLSSLVARLGHKDEFTLADAGLPVPMGIKRVDLAVSAGVPSFLEVLDALGSECVVEAVILVEELRDKNSAFHKLILTKLHEQERSQGKAISIQYLPHERFKERTGNSRAVVRTGEVTPFANCILVAGVAF
jgi:D-ribose pyranase